MIIALTGGIGSGKSTVAAFFAELNVPIIDADEITRELTKPHSAVLAQIAAHFGSAFLTEKGELDRALLREKIFESPDDKEFLENLLHPLVYGVIQEEAKKISAPYVIAVIPLLIETKGEKRFDRVIVVDSPEELQIARVQKRDNMSEEEIARIMKSQAYRKDRLRKADDVIVNDGDKEHLRQQVLLLKRNYDTTIAAI